MNRYGEKRLGATTAVLGRIRRFFKTVSGQTIIALSFNIISLFAGGLMVVFTSQFTAHPWILALYPPILTIRGGIGGIFSGNLATMLHLGLVKPQIRDNTENYWSLIKSVLVITTFDTLILGSFAFLINLVNGSALPSQWFLFLCIPTVVCLLAVCISLPITSIIAIATFRRGLDPDILVYPILASLNDIIVTSVFVVSVFFVFWGGLFFKGLTLIFFIILVSTVYTFMKNQDDKSFQQTLREGTFIVIISSLFGSVNGVLLSNLGSVLASRPGLMTMYPALTNSLGNIGSIIGSKTTTDIALGYSKNFIEELKASGKSIIQVEIPAFFMHIVFAVSSYLLSVSQGANLLSLLVIALTSNLLSFIVISIFSLWSAYLAYERGLNPDNIVIPAITSVSDTTGTLMITPAVFIARLLGL